ncbi:MAG: NAD-dependent epimerase/dehydratase family protein [Planctomycetota bacterium]
MRVLVTGANGFVGKHLVAALSSAGHDVVATSRSGGDGSQPLELPDLARAEELLDEQRPDAIYHLAAVAEVPKADKDPVTAFRSNVDGTVSLLEGARRAHPSTRFFFVSSSNVYGVVPVAEQPIAECRGYAPAGVYASSKVAAECWVRSYANQLQSPPVILRPFNHVGPGQSPSYALPAFARQIVEIENGAEPIVRVGNLEVRRDILDVRDVTRAYVRLLQQPQLPPVLNVCAGRSYLLSELLAQLCAASSADVQVEVDPMRLRGNDLTLLEGDATQVRAALEWSPQIPMHETLRSLLTDWRSRMTASGSATECHDRQGT